MRIIWRNIGGKQAIHICEATPMIFRQQAQIALFLNEDVVTLQHFKHKGSALGFVQAGELFCIKRRGNIVKR